MNTIEQLLEHHFSYNCVPALPKAYVQPAIDALHWVKEGEFGVIVYLPKNIEVLPKNAKRQGDEIYITASDLVDALRIDAPEFYNLLPS